MVKHTYFSVELSILKHPFVTVVNKRRKEPNYGQELALFKVNRQRPSKLVGKVVQARQIEIKNHYILRHTGSTPGYDQDI